MRWRETARWRRVASRPPLRLAPQRASRKASTALRPPKAKELLTQMGYEYAEVPLPHTTRSRIVGAVTGAKTVPQVFINGRNIGGLEALEELARKAA
jgi:glutaredoxin